MGKKVKKGKNPHKDKVVALSPKIARKQNSQIPPIVGASIMNKKKTCPHLDKGVDLVKLSETIGCTESVRCQDCCQGAADRRGGNKGKGNKKGTDPKSAIWCCLDCGHFACGGVGYPTVPTSHSIRHFKATHHPLAMNFGNPKLCWCFSCNALIPVKKLEENDDKSNNLLLDVVKLIKGRLVEEVSGDGESVSLKCGSIKSEIISEGTIASGIDGQVGYVVRGLVNLGNTCYFNSIMQNLLSMDRLRDYFMKLDDSFGPLTVSLKKLFGETSPESLVKNVVNPRSFFGCLCSKYPQFRGYGQHDSHELLHCLLDGLCTEELSYRKRNTVKENTVSTFVDAIFGGQISSTVCCTECGHSSIVYEPFLDLSLPVPTKTPLGIKAKPISQAKKTKMAPKKLGNSLSKLKKNNVLKKSSNTFDSFQVQSSSVSNAENNASSDDFSWLDFIGPNPGPSENDLDLCNLSVTHEIENGKLLQGDLDGLNDSSCVENLEPEIVTDYEVTSQYNDTSSIQESKIEVNNIFSSEICREDELPLQVQASEVILLSYKEESSTTEKKVEEGDETSLADHEQDSFDYGGFGDLFNEPEIATASTNPLSGNSQDNIDSCESTDEVDNTNSPVSVESCLSYFTAPELLSNEHAWHCDNCSKIMQRDKMKLEKNKEKITTESDSIDHTQVKNINNGNIENGIDENSQQEETGAVTNGDPPEISASQASTDDQSCSSSNKSNGKIYNTRYSKSVKEYDTKESTDGKIDMKVKRDATKRFLIDKAPPILTVHLKRFSQDARGRLSKLKGHVGFGETFDLLPFMDPRYKESEKYNYRLLGMVEHSGSMKSGHYIAYMRGSAKSKGNNAEKEDAWYYASDGNVRHASLGEVLGCEAYILFYEKM